MNRKIGKSIIAVIISAAFGCGMVAGTCFGAPPDIVLFAGVTGEVHAFRLLETDLVAKDLGLTAEQANEIRSLHDELNKADERAFKSMFRNGRLTATEEPDYGGPVRKKLLAALRPEQFARFVEIVNQEEGPEFFNTSPDRGDPNLANEFRLSPEQIKKINAILDHYVARWNGPIDAPNTYDGFFIWEQRVGQSALDEIIKVLTPAQKRQYLRCVGRPVDLATLADQATQVISRLEDGSGYSVDGGGFIFFDYKFKP